ncbi:PorT family protein [Hymenobacter sp. 15J16-1T3B]|uniref:outer membrane beta-barrel protein n=1 Tax=Hymenobacter sp. 15J16-1T3B TaxID=2886941 RepID=UPI001D125798|nr:outer membrane beta-barrel protein [Hymenobacter sp. 15J16-1T3B]MCC3159186.1 PorT family protein [Hymenobacter sp. 15J16-1T3B]
MFTKYSVALLGLLLTASAAQAQVYLSAGPTLGVSSSTVSGDMFLGYYGSAYEKSRLTAPQAGVTFSARLGHFALQPALLYTEKGLLTSRDAEGQYSYQSQRYHSHTKYNFSARYLELPVNVVGTLGRDGRGLQLLAGPYVALTLSGTRHFEEYYDEQIVVAPGSEHPSFDRHAYDQDYRIGKSGDPRSGDLPLHRFDWGANLGAGYALGHWQVQAIYSVSLAGSPPTTPTYNTSTSAHFYTPYRVWQARLSYLIGGQRERKLPAFLNFLNLKPAQ